MTKSNTAPSATNDQTDYETYLFYDLPDTIGDFLRTKPFKFHPSFNSKKDMRDCVKKLLKKSLAELNAIHQKLLDKVEEHRNAERRYAIINDLISMSQKYITPIDIDE